MKILLLTMAMVIFGRTSAQFIGTRTNTLDSTQARYVTNSPLNTPGHSREVERIKDSTFHRLLSNNVRIDRLNYKHDDGIATNVVFVNDSGSLRRGHFPVSSAPDSSVYATRNYVINSGFMRYVDTQFLSNRINLKLNIVDTANHWQPKGAYLTSESDPLSLHPADSSGMLSPYLRKADAAATYQPIGNYSTIAQLAQKVNLSDTGSMLSPYLRQAQAAATYQVKGNYLTSEVDGSVTNELQNLSLIADSLKISQGNAVALPYLRSYTETDPLSVHITDSNKMLSPYLRKIDTTGKWQPKGNYLTAEVDGSTTNELQNLSIVNRTISISQGNSITVPQADFDSLLHKPVFPATYRDSVVYYNSSGRITQLIKHWTDSVAPTLANGFNVDISSAGFTKILNVQVTAVRSTTAAISVPIVGLNGYTITQVSLNIIQSNNALLSGLGILVPGLIFLTTLVGTKVFIDVTGY